MIRPASLPGFVPTSQAGSSAVAPTPTQTLDAPPSKHLRADFAKELETRMGGWMGEKGTEKRAFLEKAANAYLNPDKSGIDLSKLPKRTQEDLAKLQGAAEGIEAIFVKKLLSQMRSASFLDEKSRPMADMAKDMMDQAIAEQSAKSRSTVGIARLVFLDTAQTMVRAAIAANSASETQHD